MSEDKKEEKHRQPLGVSEFLPKGARDILVDAAHKAWFESNDFLRAKYINDAIKKVKRIYGSYFLPPENLGK